MNKCFFVLLIFASTPAFAGLLFEPIAGYMMGDYKTSQINTHTEENGRIDGFAYGGRVGWIAGGIFLGGEYQAARAQWKLDGANESTNWSNQTIFGELGYESILGLRGFIGVSVKPHVSELSSTPERVKYTGSAKKLGLGYRYRGVPIALNAEYIMYDLTDSETGSVKTKIKDNFEKFHYTAVMISFSFPFEF